MGIDEKKAYWDSRYSKEGKIWGDTPSMSAQYALKLFKKYRINTILVPGSGYGRHTKFFSNLNYKVTGIELSPVAFNIAKKFDLKSKFINDSAITIESLGNKFDAIFCFNLLHLFLQQKREEFLRNSYNQLHAKGYIFFTVFSEEEHTLGKGKMIEEFTFESKSGRPTHYFTKHDLINQFHEFSVIEEGIIEEPEDHGERGSHSHILRYIFAEK